MSKNICFCMGLLGLACMMLTGCQSVNDNNGNGQKKSTGKKVAKMAVKAAVRHSPVAIIKAVTK